MAAAVVLAAKAPLKSEDKRVAPLPRVEITLGELVEAGVIYDLFDPNHKTRNVRLRSLTPTRREVMEAIGEQTGFRASIFHCGNGATILFGSGGGRIRVADRSTNEPPTTTEPRPTAAADAHGATPTAPSIR
jgi:hypothetical protein